MRNRSKENVLEESECLEIVKKKLSQDKMEDFSLVKYELIPLDSTTGYMGQYFTLKATVASPRSPLDTKIINFFAKIPPPDDTPLGQYNQEQGSFKKEVDLYTKVFPEIMRGIQQYNIPECFLGLDGDVIVLEDMSPKGYTMINKFVPFDVEHCRIVMKALAKFHAESIIFEEMYKKNLHEEFPHCMRETLWPAREGRAKQMLHAAVKGVISMIDLVDAIDEIGKIKLKEKFLAMSKNHSERLSPSDKFKNVLCHGDLWANNILFKYDEEGKPDSCCLIDFQLARYNPPAHDILCFFQFTTTRKLRDEHGPELFKLYHESLSNHLTEADLDSVKIFPLDDFLQSIEELRTFTMFHGMLNIPMMLLESQTVEKYFNQNIGFLESYLYADRTPLLCVQFRKMKIYRERMIDALLELYDRLIVK